MNHVLLVITALFQCAVNSDWYHQTLTSRWVLFKFYCFVLLLDSYHLRREPSVTENRYSPDYQTLTVSDLLHFVHHSQISF